MADFEIKRGDTAPALVAVLRDRSNAPVNLTSATAMFVMRSATAASGTAPAIAQQMDVATDQVANKGQVTYEWSPEDTAVPGAFVGEFVVTWSSGAEQTFPTTGFVSIVVNDDLESHLMAMRAPVAVARALTTASDAEAKTWIARKTAASTAPLLTDDDLNALVEVARKPNGRYNLNRAAAEGWTIKAARAASGFTFTADGVQVDKSTIMAHCLEMKAAFERGTVGIIRVEPILSPSDL